ncbi:partial soluble lytic murein transglycosylase, partial [Rhodocyclaceae bacterium]
AAREAFRNGERVRLARSIEALKGHELLPWAEYWQLRLRIEDSQSDGVAEFLQREEGSYIAEKLRTDWLKAVGKRREWEAFRSEYPKLVQPDQEVTCYALQARLADQQDRTALDEARPLWFSLLDMPESCLPLMEQLILEQRIDNDAAWARMRRLLEGKKLTQAKLFARYLPRGQEPDGKLLETIADKPARYVARLPANFAATRLGREMALYAIQRMARSDPETTAAQWRDIEDRFPAAERAYGWGQIAWQAALRAHDWTTVRRTVEQMPPHLAGDPAWVYWLARSLASHGRQQEANALYQKIGGQPNFYGNLADEELGRSIALPAKAAPPTAEELAQAAANPALRRALALMRLDIRIEGVREWNWTVRGMNDRQLLAAAEFARKHDIFDRAISTADRTLAQHDYGLRYLAPYREYVEPKARELALDHSWVYGLMRQESRFVTNARSTVGAKGLMQVMPATAKWVAKKINLPHFHPARVAEMDTNVTLGTNYLKMVLESLDNHPVLASAAYNAGPGRARRWRAEQPLEGAIYAETIPFNETRDYVKKVMSNAIYYAALFDEKPQSLKSRLGVVRPKGNGDATTEELP